MLSFRQICRFDPFSEPVTNRGQHRQRIFPPTSACPKFTQSQRCPQLPGKSPLLLRECNRLQKQAFCFSDIFIRAQRNCTSRAKDFRCPPMLRTLVVRIDLPHPVQSITVALRIDGGLNEFGSECRVEYAVLTVLKQFETFADEHRRVVILPPFGLAQPQYAKTDPLIASGRMGSRMLSKFERVIFDGIDIDSRYLLRLVHAFATLMGMGKPSVVAASIARAPILSACLGNP
jgi:hypothetical protein